MSKQISIRSYFSIPTNLAAEMSDWPEFISGEGYTVDLKDLTTQDTVSIRFVQRSRLVDYGKFCYQLSKRQKKG